MKQAGASSNSAKFHPCCFTFSSKKMRKQLGHPADQAITFRRLLEQHRVTTEEGFANLLRLLSAAREDDKAGQVPTWNCHHPKPDDIGKREPSLPLAEALHKRVAALESRNNHLTDLVEEHELEYFKMYDMINDLRRQLVLASAHQHYNYYCYDSLLKGLLVRPNKRWLDSIEEKARLKAFKEADLVIRKHLSPYPSEVVKNLVHCRETLVMGQDMGCAACRGTLTFCDPEYNKVPTDQESRKQDGK